MDIGTFSFGRGKIIYPRLYYIITYLNKLTFNPNAKKVVVFGISYQGRPVEGIIQGDNGCP
jgi:hypothetical protein